MITLQELYHYLDGFFESSKFKDYAINGLQIGPDISKNIKVVATAVTASLETIEKAIALKADALLVHHGIFWRGESPALIGMLGKRANLLIKNQIALLAYHLPLDAHKTVGNNWKAARDLGWEECQPFGLFDGLEIGVRGIFPKIDVKVFCQKLEEYYGHKAVVALGGKKIVSSAALISGGAYKSIKEASQANVDCFITGNFDEPAWHMAMEEGGGVNFFSLGHNATERVGPIALAEHLKNHLGLEASFIDTYNPF